MTSGSPGSDMQIECKQYVGQQDLNKKMKDGFYQKKKVKCKQSYGKVAYIGATDTAVV